MTILIAYNFTSIISIYYIDVRSCTIFYPLKPSIGGTTMVENTMRAITRRFPNLNGFQIYLIGLFLFVIPALMVGLAISSFIIMFVWSWVVPDLFSGLVQHGLLSAQITFWQSFKFLFLLMSVSVIQLPAALMKQITEAKETL